MNWHNTLNVKLSNSQLIKLKSRVKNGAQVALNLSSKIIGDDETNFSKTFVNVLIANIKPSKTQLSKMVQLVGFLGDLIGRLLQADNGSKVTQDGTKRCNKWRKKRVAHS